MSSKLNLVLMVYAIIIGGIMIILPGFDIECIACVNSLQIGLGVISVLLGASALILSRNAAKTRQ